MVTADVNVRDAVIRKLDELPNEQLWRLLGYADGLAASRPQPTPTRELLRLAGTIPPEDVDAMERAIEEGCERVDENEW